MKLSKRLILILGVFFVLVLGIYLWLFRANVPTTLNEPYLYIKTGSNLAQLKAELLEQGFIKDEANYDTWASLLGFQLARPGRYKIEKGWSSYRLIKHLQLGEQAPVKFVVNGLSRAEQIAGRAGKLFEHDSLALLTLLRDTVYLDSIGYTPERLVCLFLPDTYQFNWNTSPRQLVQRMLKEHDRFWNSARKEKAAALDLTPDEAYIVASIVDGETNLVAEMPTVAGTYLNRLRIGMKLEADPTVQYALIDTYGGTWRRLKFEDYNFPHRYNTYLHKGIPPGPVTMPSQKAIDATLSPEQHDYIFFVAQPNNSGGHAFSKSFGEHQVKSRQFHQWVRSRPSS